MLLEGLKPETSRLVNFVIDHKLWACLEWRRTAWHVEIFSYIEKRSVIITDVNMDIAIDYAITNAIKSFRCRSIDWSDLI